MQLVAAAKMKKAQDQALAGRDYAEQLNQVLVRPPENFNEESHPLLEQREGNRELVLVISTDKGLCGALNTNLAKAIRAHDLAGRALRHRRPQAAHAAVTRLGTNDDRGFRGARIRCPSPRPARSPSCSPSSSSTATTTRCPSPSPTSSTRCARSRCGQPAAADPGPPRRRGAGRYEAIGSGFSAEEHIKDAVPRLPLRAETPPRCSTRCCRSTSTTRSTRRHVEARASEHSARMVAMKSATDNAKKFIKELTLEYNKLRQARHHLRASRNHHRHEGHGMSAECAVISFQCSSRRPRTDATSRTTTRPLNTEHFTLQTSPHEQHRNHRPESSAPSSTPTSPRPAKLPEIYNALEIQYDLNGVDTKLVLEVAAAPRRRLGARGRHVHHRRPQARHGRSPTPASRSPCPSASRCSAASSTSPATWWTRTCRSPMRTTRYPIHRPRSDAHRAVRHRRRSFATGIKVIDLICPLLKGGKGGMFGGAGVGKTVVIMELINNIAKSARWILRLRRCG